MLCDEKHVRKNNEIINKVNSIVHVGVQFALFLINHQTSSLWSLISLWTQIMQTCVVACHIKYVQGECPSV